MSMTRRTAIKILAGAVPAVGALRLQAAAAEDAGLNIQSGPFKGTRESLRAYRVPDWFRDAKFGI